MKKKNIDFIRQIEFYTSCDTSHKGALTMFLF